MSRFLKITLCFLLCVSFFGCSAKIENTEKSSLAENQSVLSEVSESPLTTAQTTTESNTKNTTKAKEKTTKKKENKTNPTTEATKNTKPEKTTKKKIQQSQPSANSQETTEAEATATVAATTAQTTTKPDYFNCTYSIECTQILENKDKLKAGHIDYVPENGVLLANSSVNVKNGESVFDALERICSENNIKLSSRSDVYGKYVVGFNNIDEKDCGTRSGWTYTVNGAYPPKSCDRYKLSPDDKVVFIYTCS